MPDAQEAQCPLCDQAAVFEVVDRDNARYFACPQCVDFSISNAASRYLLKHPERRASLASQSARLRGTGDELVITLVAGEGLHTEPRPRAMNPRRM